MTEAGSTSAAPGLDGPHVVEALRRAGARFAYVFGSRAGGSARPDSDVDVAASFGANPPATWEVELPDGVDLLVLEGAPLHLAGRVAQQGRLLFDDDPPARVRWESTTRLVYLDELPYIQEMSAAYLEAVASRGRR